MRATPTGRWRRAKLGYDPVLFGYTDTSRDPRGEPDDQPWLRTYEGPLPGVRPIVHLDGQPKPWTDWLAAQGYEVPETPQQAYGWRAPGPDWEDGAAEPRPLAFPAEVDDVAFLTGRLIDYLKGRASGRSSPTSRCCARTRRSSRRGPTTRMYDPAAVPGFNRAASPAEEAHAASVARLAAEAPRLRRAGEREAAAAAEGGLLRADEPGGRRARPAVRLPEGERALGAHADRLHPRPRRRARRPLADEQGRLLRRGLPHPADRPRSAGRRGARPARRSLHRERRHPADHDGGDRRADPAAVRRHEPGAVPGRRASRRSGARRRTGSSTSATWATRAPSRRSA